jgi:hypothetical protein
VGAAPKVNAAAAVAGGADTEAGAVAENPNVVTDAASFGTSVAFAPKVKGAAAAVVKGPPALAADAGALAGLSMLPNDRDILAGFALSTAGGEVGAAAVAVAGLPKEKPVNDAAAGAGAAPAEDAVELGAPNEKPEVLEGATAVVLVEAALLNDGTETVVAAVEDDNAPKENPPGPMTLGAAGAAVADEGAANPKLGVGALAAADGPIAVIVAVATEEAVVVSDGRVDSQETHFSVPFSFGTKHAGHLILSDFIACAQIDVAGGAAVVVEAVVVDEGTGAATKVDAFEGASKEIEAAEDADADDPVLELLVPRETSQDTHFAALRSLGTMQEGHLIVSALAAISQIEGAAVVEEDADVGITVVIEVEVEFDVEDFIVSVVELLSRPPLAALVSAAVRGSENVNLITG